MGNERDSTSFRTPRVLDAQLVHDLRNPLGCIHAATRLLVRSKEDPALVQQMAEAIRSEVKNLLALLDAAYQDDTDAEWLAAAAQAEAEEEQALGLKREVSTGPASQPSAAVKVIVADDNPESAQMLAMGLRLEGHAVSVAYDGEQALLLAEAQHPQVIVLDISMPRKNGYELARELRGRTWSAATKLIAVSGHPREDYETRAHDAGFDAYMTKPIDMDRLNRMLVS